MRPVRLMYGDVDDEEKLEKDRTLMLRPIVTDRTRLVATRNDRTLGFCIRSL